MSTTPERTPTSYRGVPAPAWLDDWTTASAAAWKEGVDAALAFAALGGSDPDPAALFHSLADTLNALVAVGRFPAFHDLSGSANGWQHQPCVTSSAHENSPWVVLDTATGRFTLTTRKRAVSGEHSRRPRRKR